MKQIFTVAFLLIATFCLSQDNIRYATPIFKDYNIYENIIYSEAIPYNMEGKEVSQVYTLDFYEPTNDAVVNRPLVLLFPDGDFIVGNKEQDDIVNWCKELTTYGYTCACVNYRQGYDASTTDGINRAMYRGVQDGRAAIRYLIEYQRTFKINPNKIYVGGYKSGAVIALHTAFMDKEEERPSSTYAYNTGRDLDCLDCSGNPFEHSINVAGVLNVDGAIYNPQIMTNNTDVTVFNLHIETPKLEINGNRLGHRIGADVIDGFPSKYNSNFLHHYLDSLNFQSSYQQLARDTGTVGFVNTNTNIKTKAVVGFLNNDLKFKTIQPEGKSKVCEHSSSTVSVPFEKNCKYEWFVENGTIELESLNTLSIKWNKGSGVGAVSVVKTDATGVRGLLSDVFKVAITPQPIADFEISYLSDNIIKLKDKSLYANLFAVDFGFEGEMYQGKPNTNASFTYLDNGTYFLTQTVENICGFATQSIPVEVSMSSLYNKKNVAFTLNELPSLIEKGLDVHLDRSKLEDIKNLTIQIKGETDETLVEAKYTYEQKDLIINTSVLEKGTYFIEIFSEQNILMTKKVRVQ